MIPGSGWAGAGKFAHSGAGMITFGTIMGGAGAALTGGNFWQGAVTGLVVSGLNHAMHQVIDPPGGQKQPPHMKKLIKSWFSENQYFSAEAGLRTGTYVDFTPFKKVLGLRVGEYRESSYKSDYYGNKTNTSINDNHYFEFPR